MKFYKFLIFTFPLLIVSFSRAQEADEINFQSFNKRYEYTLEQVATIDNLRLDLVLNLRVDYETIQEDWISFIGQLENLEEINIWAYSKNSSFNLFEKIEHELQLLTNLKTMHLQVFNNKRFEFYKELSNLTTLNINLNDSDQQLISIEKLKKLENLTIEGKCLESFEIRQDELQHLKMLRISFDAIKTISIAKLDSLSNLELNLKNLKQLQLKWGNFPQLDTLIIYGSNLVEIEGDFAQVENLNLLELRSMYKLKNMPRGFSSIRLKELVITGARELNTDAIGLNLSELTMVELKGLRLKGFVNSLSKAKHIEELTVSANELIKLTDKELKSLRRIKMVIIDPTFLTSYDGKHFQVAIYNFSSEELQRLKSCLPNIYYY